MQVAIELPNDFTQLRGVDQITYALCLFKSAEVTLSKAAELAGIDLYDFMSACKQGQIPVIDINEEELREELSEMLAL